MALPIAVRQALTKPLYLTQEFLFKHIALVTTLGQIKFKDKSFYWIKLNETIFHPHGGGQLSDIGTIDEIPVDYVYKEKLTGYDFNIMHCFANPVNFKMNQVVTLVVNDKNRYLNSLWHTGAHVIDYLIVKHFPYLKGISGQCYPYNAFMKFTSLNGQYPHPIDVKNAINIGYLEMLKQKTSLMLIKENGIRKLKIGDHPIPCGGTHIHNLEELGFLTAKNATFEKKEDKLRVSYQITLP